MNTLNLNVSTDGESPRGWQQSMLLQSPKAGFLSKSNLPFIILFFGAGLLVGATWSKHGLEAAPRVSAMAKRKHLLTSTADTYADVGETTGTNHLRGHGADGHFPLAWLMSFPNSGTSYTSYLVRTVSGYHTSSNYGTENLGLDGTSAVMFKDSPQGPFWSNPLKQIYSMPSANGEFKGYILTKTHCGGYCNQCPPEKYVENHQTFSSRCFEGDRIIKDDNGEPIVVRGSYRKDLVDRAVHLIRDPFDNIVSRFHLAYKRYDKNNDTAWLAMYPKSKKGFRAFCKDLGERFYKQEKASRFHSGVFEDVKDVPCRADFFRYIQWHDLAFTTTWNLGLPTLILHYENYTKSFNQTMELLFDFIEQDIINDPPTFVTGKTYREYFTEDEVKAVHTMFSKLALEKTWYHTKHYFE